MVNFVFIIDIKETNMQEINKTPVKKMQKVAELEQEEEECFDWNSKELVISFTIF